MGDKKVVYVGSLDDGSEIQIVYHPEIVTDDHLLSINIAKGDDWHCVSLQYCKDGDKSSYDGCNNLSDCTDCLFHKDTFRSVDDFTDYLVEHKLITSEILLQLTLSGALIYKDD